MMHKYCFKALDRSMRDALRGEDGHPYRIQFCGKVFVVGDNFQQILCFIPKGTQQNIVFAIVNSSSL